MDGLSSPVEDIGLNGGVLRGQGSLDSSRGANQISGENGQLMFVLHADNTLALSNPGEEVSSLSSGSMMLPPSSAHVSLSVAPSLMEGTSRCPVTNKVVKYYYQDLMPGHVTPVSTIDDRGLRLTLSTGKGDNSASSGGALGQGLGIRGSGFDKDLQTGTSACTWITLPSPQVVRMDTDSSVQTELDREAKSNVSSVKKKHSVVSRVENAGVKLVPVNSMNPVKLRKPMTDPCVVAQSQKLINFDTSLVSNLGRLQGLPAGTKLDDCKIIIVNQPQRDSSNTSDLNQKPSEIQSVTDPGAGFKKKAAAILRKSKSDQLSMKDITEPDTGISPFEGIIPDHLVSSSALTTSQPCSSVNLGPSPMDTLNLSRPHDVQANFERDLKDYSMILLQNQLGRSMEAEAITEKLYEDSFLPGQMMLCLWQLQQEQMTCDAVMHVSDQTVKVHKLVLASISCVVYESLSESSIQQMMQIKLPNTISMQSLHDFITYIYVAKVTISLSNVKDLYRLSTLFQLSQLKRNCYHFCKLAKAGQLIIEAPSEKLMIYYTDLDPLYNSTEIHIPDTDVDFSNKGLTDNIYLSKDPHLVDSKLIDNVTPQQTYPGGSATNRSMEESQRNIPIRKRNRSRKGADSLQLGPYKRVEKENNLKVYIAKRENGNATAGNVGEVGQESGTPNETGHAQVDSIGALKPESLLAQVQGWEKERTVTAGKIQTRSSGKKKQVAETSLSTHTANVIAYTEAGEKKMTGKKGSRKMPAEQQGPVNDLTNLDILLSAAEAPDHDDKGLVKKGRVRKGLYDLTDPPKDEVVYMRPPPKKRTKEIRAMMQHESSLDENDTQVTEMITQASNIVETPPKKTAKAKTKSKRRLSSRPDDSQELLDLADQLAQKVSSLEEKHFKCTFCGNDFVFPKRVVTHIFKTHDVMLEDILKYVSIEDKVSTPKECDICGYKTKDNSLYYIHYHKYFRHGVPLPKGWTPYTCDFCGKEFFTKFQLRDHKLIHFEDTPFVCEHCGTGFKSRTCLNSHVFHRHSSVRRHKCSDCTKTFKTRTQMLVHHRTHTGEKPFHCSVCNYKSTTRGNMRLHLVNRHKFDADKVKEMMKQLKSVLDDSVDSHDIESNFSETMAKNFALMQEVSKETSVGQETQTGVTGNCLQSSNETEQEMIENAPLLENQTAISTRIYPSVLEGATSSSDGLNVNCSNALHRQVQVLIQEGENPREIRVILEPNFVENQDSIAPKGGRKEIVAETTSNSSRMLMRDFQASEDRTIIPIANIVPVSEAQLAQMPSSLFPDVQSLGLEVKAQDLSTPSTVADSRTLIQDLQRVDNSQLTPMVPILLKPLTIQPLLDHPPPPPTYQQSVMSPQTSPQHFLEGGGGGLVLQTTLSSAAQPVSGSGITMVSDSQLTLTSQSYDIVTSQASSTGQYTDQNIMMYQYYNPAYQQEYQ